ncbi:MAG TPA: hypothetical protein VIY09_07580 [Rhizomicrobium sp.]
MGAEVRRGSPGWRLVTWVLLLAFTLQSFVTQTHIHWAPRASAGATIAKVLESTSGHRSPIENAATCPFCQAIVHAGAFFASAAPLLRLPVVWAECTIPRLIAAASRAPSAHNWQSRAPPQH